MTHLSLYRKWRPQAFSEVVGQNHITRTLSNALKKNRLAHVYLFAGSRGTGKTSVAKILARAANCEKGPTPTPCNSCSSCQSISQGKSMDVLEIDAASNRGIDEIRDLREKIYFAPTSCRYKVYIIDEVHMLTTEAFNALLKMLEEPPPHALFVLATTEPHKVPLTVLSRCQRFDFQPLSVSEIEKRLAEVAKAEKISLEDGAATFIAQYAQGSLRDAVGILDQISSFTGGQVRIEDATSLLGIIESELFYEVTNIIAEKNATAGFSFVQKLVDEGKDLRQFIKGLTEYFRNLFVIKTSSEAEKIISALPETIEKMKEQTSLFGPDRLINFMETLSEAYQKARVSSEGRFVLETTLVRLVREESLSEQSLLGRLERLEKQLKSLAAKVFPPRTVVRAAEVPAKTEDRSRDGVPNAKTSAKTPELKPVLEAKNAVESAVSTAPPAKNQPKEADFSRIERSWPVVLNRLKKEKISTYALLLECQPVTLHKNTLILEFKPGAVFHKEEIEKPANMNLLQSLIHEALGLRISIKCEFK
ncbi:MAG TPA: DNA polymerase III subunit gamma/tau, partial [Candidatus Subteraquimicrobiales bacterium]